MRTLDLGGWGGGGCCTPAVIPSPLFRYISLLDSLVWNTYFWQLNLIFLHFKLGVQTHYPLAWMFFFRTQTTVFPTSYRLKTLFLLSLKTQQWCMPTQPHSQSFFSNAEERKSDQSLHILPSAALVKQQACLVSESKRIKVFGIGNSFLY